MMLPQNIILCLYIAMVWSATCVVCFMKYSHYRKFSDKIAVANTTSEWASDLSCVVDTLIENMETTLKASETIQCFTTRGDHAERSLWKIVGRRKVIHRTQNTTPRQKIRKPIKPTVRERHYRNSSFILLFDVKNRVVFKLKEGPNQRHTKYVYPEGDVLRDIEYSTKDRTIVWVCQWRIVSTPLKSDLTKKDASYYEWRERCRFLGRRLSKRG